MSCFWIIWLVRSGMPLITRGGGPDTQTDGHFDLYKASAQRADALRKKIMCYVTCAINYFAPKVKSYVSKQIPLFIHAVFLVHPYIFRCVTIQIWLCVHAKSIMGPCKWVAKTKNTFSAPKFWPFLSKKIINLRLMSFLQFSLWDLFAIGWFNFWPL